MLSIVRVNRAPVKTCLVKAGSGGTLLLAAIPPSKGIMHDKTETLAHKRVLITGGTTGIGRATALLLAAQRARVFIFGRHKKELDDAMRDLTHVSQEMYGTIADTANPEDVRRVFTEADQKLGRLDVFINNAALAAEGLLDMKFEDWEYVVRAKSNRLHALRPGSGTTHEAARRWSYYQYWFHERGCA